MRRALSLALAAAALLAGCVGTPDSTTKKEDAARLDAGLGSGGGGSVLNLAPAIPLFAASPHEALNDGAGLFVLNVTVFDANAEQTLAALAVRGEGALTLNVLRAVTADDVARETEPETFGPDGWKVWTGPNARDGMLHAKYRAMVPRQAQLGMVTWTVKVTDQAGASMESPPVATMVRPFERLQVSAVPILADGTPHLGASWGGWSAQPGATNVSATNYLKIVNVGARDSLTVVVDFTDAAWVGAFDNSFGIPIDGNVQFRYFEDDTPFVSYPAEGAFVPLPVSPYGTAVIPFTGSGNVVYVTYTILALPSVLPAQPYRASFTVTEA